MTSPIRVAVLDDRPLVARGLSALLDLAPDLEVLREAHSVEAAFGMLGSEVAPEVFVASVVTRDGGAPALLRRAEGLRVVALSPSTGYCHIRDALEAGARGFVLEDMPPDALPAAIRAVHTGRRFIPDVVAERVTIAMQLDGFTARELDVLRHLAVGLSNEAIGNALAIGTGTVKSHIAKLMTKLHAETRTEAVARALEYGLLDLRGLGPGLTD